MSFPLGRARDGRRVARSCLVARASVEALERRKLFCDLPHGHPVPAWTFPVEPIGGGGGSGGGDVGEPADIVWANRGVSSGVTTDNFDLVWGARAAPARAVVDAVIRHYEQVVTSFNRPDGTSQLMLNISMDLTVADQTALAPGATLFSGGKPKNGGLLLGSGSDLHGAGYWLDPTPDDHSEFLNPDGSGTESAYTSTADSFPQPPLNGRDFYSIIAIEMTHNLGLSSASDTLPNQSGIITNTHIVNNSQEGTGAGVYFTFNGPSVDHLLTNYNSGQGTSTFAAHSAGPLNRSGPDVFPTGPIGPRLVTIGGVDYYGANDTYNALFGINQRTIIAEPTALMMKDGLGYSIVNPRTLPTMYAMLNSVTGRLDVRGPSEGPVVIDISQNGSLITVSVDALEDTPATGHLPGAGNLAAYVTTFNAAAVTSIYVTGYASNDVVNVRAVKPTTVNGGFGNDTINVYNTYAGVGLTIDGGDGNDTINVGNAFDGLDSIGQSFTVNGGAGNDSVYYNDVADAFNETYTIGLDFVARANTQPVTVAGVERFILNSGSGGSTFNIVNGSNSGPLVTINSGAGNDTFAVGQSNNLDFGGNFDLRGDAGADAIRFQDSANPFGDSYTLSSNNFTRSAAGTFTFSVEAVTLNAGTGANAVALTSVAGGQSMTLNGGGGNDTITIGNSDLDPIGGAVSISGDAGTDAIIFDDDAYVLGNSYALTPTVFTRTAMATVSYSVTIEAVTVLAGNGADTFAITPSSSAAYSLSGNGTTIAPGDRLTVNIAGATGTLHTPTSSSGGAFTFSNRLAVSYSGMESSVSTGGVNQVPTINSLAASANPVPANTGFTLTAGGVADADGSISSVAFYRESNGTTGLQVGSDTLLGSGTNNSGGNWSFATSSNGLVAGAHNFYARATDNLAGVSAVATLIVSIQSVANLAPVLSSVTATPNPVIVGNNLQLVANGVSDPDGSVASVAFYRESNGLGGLQVGSDVNVGTDVAIGGGWTVTVSTSGLAPGFYTYYAQPTDNVNAAGGVASVQVTVSGVGNQPPSIASLTDSPDSHLASTPFTITANGVADPDDGVQFVRFYYESNSLPGLQIAAGGGSPADTPLGVDSVANDGWSTELFFTSFSPGTYTLYALAQDMAGAVSNVVSTSNTIIADPNAPLVTLASTLLETSPLRFSYTFNKDVSASLTAADLDVGNIATNASVPVASVTWDAANLRAIFSLTGIPADGNYRTTLVGSGVLANGVPMSANHVQNFYMLAGDANRDRTVDFGDLVILSQNYNLVGKTFSQGNFNYAADGKVDFEDLVILAQRYGASMAMAMPLTAVAPPAVDGGMPGKRRRAATQIF